MAQFHSIHTGSLFKHRLGHHHFTLFFYDIISSFRFTGKMFILLILMVILTIMGNVWNASNARTIIREQIITGVINQVSSLHSQLSSLDQSDPHKFEQAAHSILMNARWESDLSGYAFLTDKQAILIVYPPDPSREGNHISSPILLKDSQESLYKAVLHIAQSGQPEVITYFYKKPGATQLIEKAAYVYPFGKYVLVSGAYLDRAEQVFRGYLQESTILLVIMLIIICGIIQLFSGAIHEQVQNVRSSLRRLSQRNLIQPPSTSAKRTGHDEFSQINREIENTRHQLSSLLRKECHMVVTLTQTAEEIHRLAGKTQRATQTVRKLVDIAPSMTQDPSSPQHQENRQRMADIQAALRLSEQIVNQLTETSQQLSKQARSIDDTVHSYILEDERR